MFVLRVLTSIDYLDELVRRRSINILILITIIAPLTNCIDHILELFKYDQTGMASFATYVILSICVSLLIINPIQIGNGTLSTKSEILLSVLSISSLIGYEIWLIVSLHIDDFNKTSNNQLITIDVYYFLSLISGIVCFLYYIYLLFKPSKKNQEFNLKKYMNLKSIYQQIQNDNNDVIAEQINKKSNHKRNYLYLIGQFWWPHTDNPQHKNDKLITYYPSRLFFAVYLGIIGVIIIFEKIIKWRIELIHQLGVLKSYIDELQGINDSLPSFTQSALNWAISLMQWIYSVGHSYKDGLLFGGIMSLILSLYSGFIIFKAWNKKLIEMRRLKSNDDIVFNDKYHYSMWFTSHLVGSISIYMIIGFVFMVMSLIHIVGFVSYFIYWSLSPFPYCWPMILSFIIYYIIFEHLMFKRIIFDKQTGSFKNKASSNVTFVLFQLLLFFNELMNLPLVIFFGLFRITIWSIFGIISYLRPDLTVYPKNMESFDIAHRAFIASIKLTIETEMKYLEKYEDHFDGIDNFNLIQEKSEIESSDNDML